MTSPRRPVADAVVLTVLVVLAHLPLVPAFGTPRLPAAVVPAAVAGAALALVGARRRWGGLTVLAALAVTFVVLSALGAPRTAVAGALPTPATLAATGVGVVTAWKDVVTLAPPLGAGGSALTAPYLTSLVGGLLAVTVAVRTTRPAWALAVPGTVLAAAILLGTASAPLALPLGLTIAVAGLAWGAWRTGRLQRERLTGVVVVLAAALGAAGVTGLVAPPAADRLVLREHVEPPFDPHAYASPLVEFRRYTKDLAEDTLLTVTGLPTGARLRLAVLDAYDGTVWSAADPTDPGAGTFRRVGARVEPELPANPVTVEVEVGGYTGVWLPQVGRSHDVDRPEGTDLYVNRTTGTGILTGGLRPGDTYRLRATVPDPPPTSALEGAPLADVTLPPVTWPDLVPAVAAEMTAEAGTPLARVQAVEGALQEGYFSHGLEGDYPSRPGHGAERLAVLLGEEPMVGDEEQYAAAMALLLRALDIPARVVVGFAPPGGAEQVTVTGADVTAWVEVAFEGHGWVPFHPTPEEDRVPQDESETPQDRPQPQVLQPPPPPPEPPAAPPADRHEVDVEDQEQEDRADARVPLLVALVVGVPLTLLLLPVGLVLGAKAWRRRRRRTRGTPATRVAGGWTELVDAARDLGVAARPTATRRQTAAALAAALPVGRRAVHSLSPRDLAERADAGTFGPAPPAEAEVAQYWQHVEGSLHLMRRTVGPRRWWRARLSLRSLRRHDRSSTKEH